VHRFRIAVICSAFDISEPRTWQTMARTSFLSEPSPTALETNGGTNKVGAIRVRTSRYDHFQIPGLGTGSGTNKLMIATTEPSQGLKKSWRSINFWIIIEIQVL
jgi:hypothetical protein